MFEWHRVEEPTMHDKADDGYGWFDSLEAIRNDLRCTLTDLEYISEESDDDELKEMDRITGMYMFIDSRQLYSRDSGQVCRVGHSWVRVHVHELDDGSVVYEHFAGENPGGSTAAYVRKRQQDDHG